MAAAQESFRSIWITNLLARRTQKPSTSRGTLLVSTIVGKGVGNCSRSIVSVKAKRPYPGRLARGISHRGLTYSGCAGTQGWLSATFAWAQISPHGSDGEA